MKNVKKYLSILTTLGFIVSAPVYSDSSRNQDLKAILETTILFSDSKISPQVDEFLSMLALEAAELCDKTIDADVAVKDFKSSFKEEKTFLKFTKPFESFTDGEVKELRQIFEKPVFHKYTENSPQIFQANLDSIKGCFKEIAEIKGVSKTQKTSQVLEITQKNYKKEVQESSKPIIIKVYSNSCAPCRVMEPIIEELSHEYKDSIRFVKIDCEKEVELAEQLGVTKLPTILFIRPGEKNATIKANGFISKKEIQAKIAELLQK